MLKEDAMHIGTEADVSAHVLNISGKRTQLRGLLDTGAVLSVTYSELATLCAPDKTLARNKGSFLLSILESKSKIR